MIEDFITENQTINLLNNSKEFKFYLGGSRRMFDLGAGVTITNDTDYDFYATFSPEIENFLRKEGFTQTLSSKDYYDSEAILILEKIEDKVQVVLRKNAEFYKKVFESINPCLYQIYLWKKSPTCNRGHIQSWFNTMFEIARKSKES